MLKIAAQALPQIAQTDMDSHTAQLLALADFPSQVDKAKQLWKGKTPASLFQALKDTFGAACIAKIRKPMKSSIAGPKTFIRCRRLTGTICCMPEALAW